MEQFNQMNGLNFGLLLVNLVIVKMKFVMNQKILLMVVLGLNLKQKKNQEVEKIVIIKEKENIKNNFFYIFFDLYNIISLFMYN